MMLLLLPIMAIPFITMLFWAMGGGKAELADVPPEKKGFNINLPNADLKEEHPLNKLNYYDRAALDSAKFEELKKKDPNYRQGTDSIGLLNRQEPPMQRSRLMMTSFRDPNEEKVYKKLEALQKAISEPPAVVEKARVPRHSQAPSIPVSENSQQLELLMQSMAGGDAEDKELQQISGLLESILDIQHPGRMQEKLKKASQAERGQVFAVGLEQKQDNISLLQKSTARSFTSGKGHNGFYSLGDNTQQSVTQNAIQASIAETQTIVNGSTVKMRLSQQVYINGTNIPKDTFIYGTASLKGERLTIKIEGVRHNNSLFPVELSVYDLDGLEGIFIPGAINRDVAKASTDRSIQSLGITSLEDSWEGQAAGAGVEAAKSLLSKKVKLIKVSVKAGYQLLLRDEKQKDKS
ncbi:conjugative transposon protein TraM [Flavobacterium subsaxonicum]|uniref:conjugative transposon protein TraM n=1 Tax=Flavobacterium subsaxonicum TaxID=426226 RepID=UPI000684B37E|nr:conjugative transposon protein TraM [Flavobacterium subsaxonicum]